MACEIVDLTGNSITGCDTTGGLLASYVCELADITAITVTADVITGFTMAATGKWKRWDYDGDNTARYDQTTNRAGKKRTYAQAFFGKFGGFDAPKILAFQNATCTCDLVAVHILNNGVRLVQGIEVSASATGGFTRSSILQTLLQADVLSDTSQNESRVEAQLVGEANKLSYTTDLTDAELEAL